MQTRNPQILSSLSNIATRTASIRRTTKETDIEVSVNLDGTGKCNAATGVPFLDHMLHQIANHLWFKRNAQVKSRHFHQEIADLDTIHYLLFQSTERHLRN